MGRLCFLRAGFTCGIRYARIGPEARDATAYAASGAASPFAASAYEASGAANAHAASGDALPEYKHFHTRRHLLRLLQSKHAKSLNQIIF